MKKTGLPGAKFPTFQKGVTMKMQLKSLCAVFMAFLLSNVSAVAVADNQMITTSEVVADLTRSQAEAQIQDLLARPDVQSAMIANGLSLKEVQMRMASLNESEMRQLATQMSEAKYGGDILIAILVVVLIIFLIQRIV
jgi:hypothetical protein